MSRTMKTEENSKARKLKPQTKREKPIAPRHLAGELHEDQSNEYDSKSGDEAIQPEYVLEQYTKYDPRWVSLT